MTTTAKIWVWTAIFVVMVLIWLFSGERRD